MREQVEAALNKVRPMLQRDGGDVELIDVTDERRGPGASQGSLRRLPHVHLTLKNGIERILKEQVPGVTQVIAIR